MIFSAVRNDIEMLWDGEIMPALLDYMRIPCESPAFDARWQQTGHLRTAASLLEDWAKLHLAPLEGATVEVVEPAGRTPSIFIDIPGRGTRPVLLYGHFDKQPAMPGWAPGRSAWEPVVENERLYGRGGADDGYALFGALAAVLVLRKHGLAHPPLKILIEGSEESGSPDLAPTLDLLAGRIGRPSIVVALDGGCGNYDQLWLTTSLRGQVAGTLEVRTLTEGVHSGDASGIVPSSFRIARHLLSRIEDAATGEVGDEAFNTSIPPERLHQAQVAGAALGAAIHGSFPVPAGARPTSELPAEQLLSRTWRPQLTVTGWDGLPSVADAAAVLQPSISLKLSLRLPPTVDAPQAAERLKELLESDPPYGAAICFNADMVSPGWNAAPLTPDLAALIDEASELAFGRSSASMGGGGGIPFLPMLEARFPGVQFLVTGVLGPQSNAHGPNEFLHLPTAKKLTGSIAHLFRSLGAQE